MRRLAAILIPLVFACAPPVLADPHADMDMTAKGDKSPASKAFAEAMHKMHAAMDIAYTDNPDFDFAKGMEPHHQGAVEMAKVELQYGKDPELRRLATAIVASQEKEIALMRRWIAHHGK